MTDAERKAKFSALLEHYNQLGRSLPTANADTLDDDAILSARLVLLEMEVVKKQIDAMLAETPKIPTDLAPPVMASSRGKSLK